MKTQSGFTLIEIMVAMAVLAILLSVGLPELRYTILSNQVTARTNDLVRSLQFARNEAMIRHFNVRLRSLEGGWSQGWVVERASDKSDAPTWITLREFKYFDEGGSVPIAIKESSANKTNIMFLTRSAELSRLEISIDKTHVSVMGTKLDEKICNRVIDIRASGQIATKRVNTNSCS